MPQTKRKKSQKRKPELFAQKSDSGEIIPSEFMEALNNNEIALKAMEKALPDHIPTICQFWILHAHTAYESLLHSYIHSENDIDEYKTITAPHQKNEERLDQLSEILSHYGFTPAPDILSDFNVIISLRNYITHGQWSSDSQKSIVQNSSFPTNINHLDINNLNRIKHVYDIITTCLLNNLLIKSSHHDEERINNILISINIDPEEFYNVDASKRHRLLFTHLGMPSDLYDSCINSKNELEKERFEKIIDKIHSFNWDKFMEIQKCFSENIKWTPL